MSPASAKMCIPENFLDMYCIIVFAQYIDLTPESPGGSDSEESACSTGDGVQSPGQEDPREKGMATRSSILVWSIPVTQGNLADNSPWGHKESDMTEQLTL